MTSYRYGYTEGTLRGTRVFIYKNLHKACWSVKALEGPHKGRVVAHTTNGALWDVAPKVSEAGRQKVLREKRKNVHAGITGKWGGELWQELGNSCREVTYNPYAGPDFTFRETGAVWNWALRASLQPKGIYVQIFD